MVVTIALTSGQLGVAAAEKMNMNVTSINNLGNLQYKRALR